LKEAVSGRCRGCYPRGAEHANQEVFRRANERLLAAVGNRIDDARPIPFICECLDPQCRSTVELSIEDFRDLLEADEHYAIVTGHPVMDGERIVEVDGGLTIVVKP